MSAVSEEMALAMAERVCVVLGADVGVAVTGVAGPAPLEGNDPGDVSSPPASMAWPRRIS